MAVQCGKCRHFTAWETDPDWRREVEEADPDYGTIGKCSAMDGVKLPYSWRWCPREAGSVNSLEWIECPAWEACRDGK